jgi:hypothetical protein
VQLGRGGVAAGLLPDQLPRKPALTVPPVARAPLYDIEEAVTLLPDWVQEAFQPWVTFWPPAKLKPRVQLLVGAALLVMTTLLWNPEFHWFATE